MEIREYYENLLKKVDGLGPIEEVVNDKEKVESIIGYAGDRHLLCAFCDRVNEGIEKATISDKELSYLRSADFMNAIINLRITTRKYSNRDPYEFERIDKINFIRLIDDTQTLVNAYTHPAILDALDQDVIKSDLSLFESQIYNKLPEVVQLSIINELIKKGDYESSSRLLESSIANKKTKRRK